MDRMSLDVSLPLEIAHDAAPRRRKEGERKSTMKEDKTVYLTQVMRNLGITPKELAASKSKLGLTLALHARDGDDDLHKKIADGLSDLAHHIKLAHEHHQRRTELGQHVA